MKRKRFTEEQIIAILREVEAGTSVRDAGRRHGVAETTIRRWRTKFAGMQVRDAKRLKGLEDENRRLKRLVAEQVLDIVMRQVVTHLLAAYPVSARHACQLVRLSRSRWHHTPT